jgi:citrate lyase subunit beta/citryl-CoA lyase
VSFTNAAFSPSEGELQWARQIINAEGDRSIDGGATKVNGAMVDRPVRLKAERILRNAR